MNQNDHLDRKLWRNPPPEYRPAPFWMWNADHDPRELCRQVREMQAHGLGGFFMHARTGLITPYLSPEWFDQIRAVVDEADRLGLQAWLYDEDRWPSGFAGGQIAQVEGLDYAAWALQCREQDGDWVVEVIRSGPSPWFNGACVPDLLNPEVVAAWIGLTHERYRQTVGEHFGRTVPGSFTDEPSFILWDRQPDHLSLLPWTGDLEDLFRHRRGYDLRPHLRSLFLDEGDFRRLRIDFYRTVTERFVESFSRQLYEWCDRHGLATTGHVMMEDSLLHQTRALGAAMPHYEYFHVPGIDHLGAAVHRAPLLEKQCASAARQFGRRRVLSESFGGAGWETPMGDLKPSGDFDWALGVNYLCQHLAFYSLRGVRKRDYPAGCTYQLPGYPLYRAFNDYFSRLSYALSQGERVCRLLVLHPVASAWARYTPLDPAAAEEWDRRFQDLAQLLLDLQRDYDFGDEMLMEKHARVEGGELIIGQARYRAVLVPPAETWSAPTLRLLREFAEQGGLLLSCEPVAGYLDGQPSPELTEFLRSPAVRLVKRLSPRALDQALAPLPRDVLLTREDGTPLQELVYQRRTLGEQDLFFLTCGRVEEEFTAQISLEGVGALQVWDAETGAVEHLPATVEDGRTLCSVRFPAQGSCLLLLDRTRRPRRPAATPSAEQRLPLDGPWQVTRLDPNVLLLDRARVKFGDSPWTGPLALVGGVQGATELPNVQDVLEKAYDDKRLWPNWPVQLRFEFTADLPAGDSPPAWVVVEDASAMPDLSLNGAPLPSSRGDWWLDREFSRFPAAGLLRPGRNRLECRVRWQRPTVPATLIFTRGGTELENCYLLGEFNVSWDGDHRFQVAPAAPLPADPSADLTRAGLPFYAGRLRYEYHLRLPQIEPGRRYVLRFPRPGGEGVRLSVNGRHVRDLWCAPFEADCTRHLRPGENQVTAELYSTLGNLFGPLHTRRPWSDAAHAYRRYFLEPLGLGGIPELRVRG